MASRQMQDSQRVWKIWIKVTMSYGFALPRLAQWKRSISRHYQGGVKRMLSHAVWRRWSVTVFWEAIGEHLLILKMQVPFYSSIPLLDSTIYNTAPVQTLKDMYWKISHVIRNKMEVRLLSMKKCTKYWAPVKRSQLEHNILTMKWVEQKQQNM